VVVLEKMPRYGGASRASGGNYGATNTPLQQQAGQTNPTWFANDSPALYCKEKLLLGGYLGDPALVRIFADNCLDGYNWLNALGFVHRGVRAYDTLGPNPMPENAQGMYLGRLWNTPYVNGEWVGAFTKGRHHTGGVYGKYFNGEAGVECLADNATKRGVEIATGMEVLEIIRAGGLAGDVLGLRVRDTVHDKEFAIRAHRAVVLAAGGFTANATLCHRYDPRLHLEVKSSGQAALGSPGAGCTGEVMMSAIDIGADAALLHMQQLSMAVSAVDAMAYGNTLIADKDGTYIDVDPKGNRFWLEMGDMAATRESRLTVLHERGFSTWWGVCDAKGANRVSVRGALERKSAVAADSLEQLAGIMGVPAANLAATVARYNGFVERQVDEDFGQIRKCLTNKIETGPFYAFAKTYTRHSSLGGVRINPNAQVLDRRDQPVPRLYAAGEFTGNVHGWERNGGCGWTNCVVFGRIAGRNAAAEQGAA
jgi:succinate dehydrogenase/fumarate reductase flavoprotein subunit